MPGLHRFAQEKLKCPPILLTSEQANVVLAQFQETARYRHWVLHAAAVMSNHFHLVVSAPEEVPSTNLLRDFKSYAARALNRQWPKPASGTWWTESGSRRPLRGTKQWKPRFTTWAISPASWRCGSPPTTI
jgi:REP element-mobilizing transposase RayT